MANSLTWNDVDLATYGVTVQDYTVPVMPDIPFSTLAAIQGDPEFTSTKHTVRTITLNLAVLGPTEADSYTNLEYVTREMNPVLTDRVFSLDAIPNRRYVGRVSSMSRPEVKGRWGWVFDVVIQCMPDAQGIDEVNASASIATDPDTLTVSGVAGTQSRIPCEFYVRNETGGDLTSTTITVSNDTTSETISWTGTLEDDRWLKFGTINSLGRFEATIEKSDSTGSDPEAEAYTGVESGYDSGDWPRLKGGTDNSITVTGVSTGTLETTYRARYIY